MAEPISANSGAIPSNEPQNQPALFKPLDPKDIIRLNPGDYDRLIQRIASRQRPPSRKTVQEYAEFYIIDAVLTLGFVQADIFQKSWMRKFCPAHSDPSNRATRDNLQAFTSAWNQVKKMLRDT